MLLVDFKGLAIPRATMIVACREKYFFFLQTKNCIFGNGDSGYFTVISSEL